MSGFSLGLTVVCIIASFLAGMMMNEANHHRARAKHANALRDRAIQARRIVRIVWGR